MQRRNFLKVSALGATTLYLGGCGDSNDSNSEVIPNPTDNATAFNIPNDDGTSVEFAVIGDNHSNGNILKGALEEIERRGIKNVLLVGDQADSSMTEEYVDGWSEPEAYIKMIEENGFDQRLNLFPVRGNHEGLRTEHDNYLTDRNIFDNMKNTWRSTIGRLLDTHDDLILPQYIREDTGELLDCSGLYAFKIGKTLFIAGDPFISEAWTTSPYDRKKVLTYTSEGEAIYSYQDWVLMLDFMKQVVDKNEGQFEHLIVFNHYPLAGRNHAGVLENEVGGVPVPGYFPQLENSDNSGITTKVLNFLSEHKALFISGHDHIFSKSLIYPQGADADESLHIHYADFENPDNNTIGSSAVGLFPDNPIHQIIVGSCSQKHYDVTRYYADQYEVPLYTLSTNRDEGKLSIFAQFKIQGDLIDIGLWGNEHDFKGDGWKDQYKIANEGVEVTQNFLDPNNWNELSAIRTISNAQKLVVPPNYSYEVNIAPETNDGGGNFKGTSGQITDGIHTAFNGLDRPRDPGNVLDGDLPIAAKYYGFSQEINMKWLSSDHAQVLSDVLLIHGMADHQGLITDQNGNETDKSTAGTIYNDSVISKDTFTIGLSLDGIDDNTPATLAFYHEEAQLWVELESTLSGGYLYAESVKFNGYFAIVSPA